MKNVLITGGTSGIGYELACVFAANQYQVSIVSSNYNQLLLTQKKLQERFGVTIRIFEQDLSQLEAAEKLYTQIQAEQIEIDVLVNNAGFGLAGETVEIDFKNDEKMMILNMLTPVKLCKLFLPSMYRRQHGSILNVSSTGAFQPGPFTSTYFASKAFLLSYSKAVRFEAQKHGVHVCTLCPGATRTNFFTREGKTMPKTAMPAEKVAQLAFRQLKQNRSVWIPGFANRAMQVLPINIKMIGIANNKKS